MLSHSVFQIGGNPDIQSRLLVNDVNPPVVHETSTQQTYSGQDFLRCTQDKLTNILSMTGIKNLKGDPKGPLLKFWLPFVQTYRTLCITPTPEIKAIFLGVRQIGAVA